MTILYSFNHAGTGGAYPRYSTLVQATDGNFYGTTSAGGANNDGVIFTITAQGVFTALHSFSGGDGSGPYGGLIQCNDGRLYGTTSNGGAGTYGTIFSLTIPASAPAPPASINSIVNDAGFQAGGPITSGSWVAVFGSNLAPAGDARQWNTSEILNGKLPTVLDGTSVTVNGKSAAVVFISPTQLNIQPPDDAAIGPVQVVVTTAAKGLSASFTVNYAQFAPGLFPAKSLYIAAQHADNSYVGGYPGATPAKPGEVIILWGTGFGSANPPVPAGQVFTGASKLVNIVTVTIGGQPAPVDFAGVVGAGLVQINVHVPLTINNGDAAVVATVGGVATQPTGNLISVHN